MASRHHLRLRYHRWTSSRPGGRMNLDGLLGYWHQLKPSRQCQREAGGPGSWRRCETFLFSLLKASSANENASGLKPIANPISVAEDAASWGSPISDLRL